MNKSLVTAVITTCNREANILERALKSVLLLQRVMVAQPVSFVTLARIQTSYFINSLPLWVALMPSCGQTGIVPFQAGMPQMVPCPQRRTRLVCQRACWPVSSHAEGGPSSLPGETLPFPCVINTYLVGRRFDLFLLNTCLIRRLDLFFNNNFTC